MTAGTTHIDALKRAAAWSNADQRTRAVLAAELMAAERHQEGLDYFAELSAAEPADALLLALAGAFETRVEGRADEAMAKLDAAAALDVGLPQYFRGTSLARLAQCGGRAETVVADLEFVLAVRDQFPPGLLRGAYAGLASAYDLLGRAEEAQAARDRSGRLITDYWVSADDGFRFVPPRLTEPVPGVYVAQGHDFADVAFVLTADGIVAIDAASTDDHLVAALRDLRRITDLPITHVILTHAHWDHIGGISPLIAGGARVIAQAAFPDELRRLKNEPPPAGYFWPRQADYQRLDVEPDHLVVAPEKMTIGGVEFVLTPIGGGETHDGLLIHLPDRRVMFTGDMSMPYLGAPFYAEGSADGLFDAMEIVIAARPTLLIHGHAGLTETYPIEAFPGLLAALRDLHGVIQSSLAAGLTAPEVLRLNHLPEVLEKHPVAVLPYLVTRDNFIQRVHRQGTGYWHPDGDGVEQFTLDELAAAADLLGGGSVQAFHTAAAELMRRGEHALALRLLDLGLISYPVAPELLGQRRDVLDRLLDQNQFINPFKFIHYATLAGLELKPVS